MSDLLVCSQLAQGQLARVDLSRLLSPFEDCWLPFAAEKVNQVLCYLISHGPWRDFLKAQVRDPQNNTT